MWSGGGRWGLCGALWEVVEAAQAWRAEGPAGPSQRGERRYQLRWVQGIWELCTCGAL